MSMKRSYVYIYKYTHTLKNHLWTFKHWSRWCCCFTRWAKYKTQQPIDENETTCETAKRGIYVMNIIRDVMFGFYKSLLLLIELTHNNQYIINTSYFRWNNQMIIQISSTNNTVKQTKQIQINIIFIRTGSAYGLK